MPDTEKPKPYEENTKEQYEALGRFVEAFEAMVNEVRESTIALIERDGKHRRLIEIVLHHQVLTAKPLYEIFRAVVVEVVDDAISLKKAKAGRVFDRDPPLVVDLMEKALQFASADRDVFLRVMSTIADEYNTLVNKRNNLLHATWFIGFQGSGDPSCSEFYVRKYATTKQGLTTVELPKNAPELRELSKRCEVTRNWIASLHSCLRGSSYIRERFEYHGKKWWLVTPGGHKTTLP
jgi:hypothetical protein